MKIESLNNKVEVIVIGTSSGGVEALMRILPEFKKPSKLAVAVVIHLPANGNNLLPSLLAPDCDFFIREATPGEELLPETIYFSPVDYHLSLEPDHTLSLSTEEPYNFSRPSIDLLFESAAYSYPRKTLGILLTGSNSDGAQGLKKIHDHGGITIVQNPQGIEYQTMPQSALNLFRPDFILSLDEIASLISKLSLQGINDER